MRVVDCRGEEFTARCHALSGMVGCSYTPDLIVGVLAGGAEVAAQVQRVSQFDAALCLVGTARPSSELKRRIFLERLVGRMPTRVLDCLRIAEHRVRERRFSSGTESARSVWIPDDATLAMVGAKRILVVDDAVDTGRTMRAVVDEIRRVSAAEIRTAAITVTFHSPLIDPDFALEHGVLMRFPWSMDAGRRG